MDLRCSVITLKPASIKTFDAFPRFPVDGQIGSPGKKTLIALLWVGGVAALAVAFATLATGDEGKRSFKADLNGYNEVVGSASAIDSGSVSTGARGIFRAKLRGNPPTHLEFELTYSGIEGGTVTQAHPHFAQRHVGGDIFGFLCVAPACPTPGGTVEGVRRDVGSNPRPVFSIGCRWHFGGILTLTT